MNPNEPTPSQLPPEQSPPAPVSQAQQQSQTQPQPQFLAQPPNEPMAAPPNMPAFMYPQSTVAGSSAIVPPKKSTKTIIIFLILLVLCLSVGGAVALVALGHKKTVPPKPAVVSDNVDQKNTPDAADDGQVIALSSSVKLAEPPTFVRPVSKQWQVITDGPSGTDGIAHPSGCKIYYSESKTRKNDAKTDAEATDKVIADTLERYKTTNNVSDPVYDKTTINIEGSDKKLEFKTATFEVSAAIGFKSVLTVREVDGYVLGLNFYCPTRAFSADLNKNFVTDLAVKLTQEKQ